MGRLAAKTRLSAARQCISSCVVGVVRINGGCTLHNMVTRPERTRMDGLGAAIFCAPSAECRLGGTLLRFPRSLYRFCGYRGPRLLHPYSHLRCVGNRQARRISADSLFIVGALRHSAQRRDLVSQLTLWT